MLRASRESWVLLYAKQCEPSRPPTVLNDIATPPLGSWAASPIGRYDRPDHPMADARYKSPSCGCQPPIYAAQNWRHRDDRPLSSGASGIKVGPAAHSPRWHQASVRLELPPHVWWTRVTVAGRYGYLVAHNPDLARWQSWLRSIAGSDLTEYQDFGGGVYRAASFAGDRIATCLFIGPARDAGDWDVVKSLFALDALSEDQRRMLLAGKSTHRLAAGRSSLPPSA